MKTWTCSCGWTHKHRRRTATALTALLLTTAATAQPAPDADEEAPDAPPSLELLEFLADWESADGQWVDPRHLGLEAPEDDDLAPPTEDDEHDR